MRSANYPRKWYLLLPLLLSLPGSPLGQWLHVGIQGQSTRVLLSKGETIYAGTESNGVYQSDDNGTTWTPAGISGQLISALYTDGVNVYVGTGGNGIYVSGSGGIGWDSIGLPGHTISSLCADAVYIFAGTGTAGVYRSNNRGATWGQANSGLTDQIGVKLTVFSGRLYAGANGMELFGSTNSGTTWTTLGSCSGKIRRFAISGSQFFVGSEAGVFIFQEPNSWTARNDGLTNLVITSLHSHNGTLYAGTGSGPFYSTDNGSHWTLKAEGLTLKSVVSLTANSNYVFLSLTNGTIYRIPVSEISSPLRPVYLPSLQR
jgi:hypothetical protein